MKIQTFLLFGIIASLLHLSQAENNLTNFINARVFLDKLWQGQWTGRCSNCEGNETGLFSKPNGLIILGQREESSKQYLYMQIYDGFSYDDQVVILEMRNQTFQGMESVVVMVDRYKNFYDIPWGGAENLDYKVLNINFENGQIEEDQNQVNFTISLVSSAQNFGLDLKALVAEVTNQSNQMLMYTLILVAVMGIKIKGAFSMIRYAKVSDNLLKISWMTMVGIFLWDFAIFKGYFIPMHALLPWGLKFIFTLILFILLMFEMAAFAILVFHAILIEPDNTSTKKTLAMKVLAILALMVIVSIHSDVCCLIMSGYLLPQIWKNYRHKKVLDDLKPILYNAATFLFILYFKGYDFAIGYVYKSLGLCMIILGFVAFQMAILFIQLRNYQKCTVARGIEDLKMYYHLIKDGEIQHKENESCSICLQALSNIPITEKEEHQKIQEVFHGYANIIKTKCGHHFHTSCLFVWIQMKTECPLCREQLHQIFINPFSAEKYQFIIQFLFL